eukprot:IDg19913t1
MYAPGYLPLLHAVLACQKETRRSSDALVGCSDRLETKRKGELIANNLSILPIAPSATAGNLAEQSYCRDGSLSWSTLLGLGCGVK